MAKALEVWFRAGRVGRLVQGDDGRLAFTYAGEWLEANPAVGLSLSLPPRPEPYDERACRSFFAGLLPEERQRRVIAQAVHVSAANDFALLDEIGGECAGALTLLPPGVSPADQPPRYRELPEEELARLILQLPRRPLLTGEDGVRISLAGAQSKLALRLEDGRYLLPLDGSPSTHILKPPIPDLADSVANEAFCLGLARRLGLPTARAMVRWIDFEPCLSVERYDRVRAGDRIDRLHQEDFCQALAVPPALKYEAEGGPSLRACFELVRAHVAVITPDLERASRSGLWRGHG